VQIFLRFIIFLQSILIFELPLLYIYIYIYIYILKRRRYHYIIKLRILKMNLVCKVVECNYSNYKLGSNFEGSKKFRLGVCLLVLFK